MRFLRLDPKTGQKLSETILDDRDPETGKNLQVYVKGLNMPVALPDVLSSDGQYVYMRSQRFDMQGKRRQIAPRDVKEQAGAGAHLFCTVGFLDDSMFHRSYWMFGKSVTSGWGGWFRAGRYAPSGRLMVCDESYVYGFGRKPEYMCQSSVLEYQLYATDKEIDSEQIRRVIAAEKSMNKTSKKRNASAADRGVRKNFPLEFAKISRCRTVQRQATSGCRKIRRFMFGLWLAATRHYSLPVRRILWMRNKRFTTPTTTRLKASLPNKVPPLKVVKGVCC
jgi:hypothetical protein